MKVVLLNGPPRCGKDTAARALTTLFRSAVRIGFADHLKVATHAAYGLFDDDGRPLPYAYFETVKDEPTSKFFGLTPRAAYIAHSETYMKAHHGQRVFGTLWCRAARRAEAPIVVVPDSGFSEEASEVVDNFGARNVLLIRIERPGCTFAGDSRSYIGLPSVTQHQMVNSLTPVAFGLAVETVVRSWLTETRA